MKYNPFARKAADRIVQVLSSNGIAGKIPHTEIEKVVEFYMADDREASARRIERARKGDRREEPYTHCADIVRGKVSVPK